MFQVTQLMPKYDPILPKHKNWKISIQWTLKKSGLTTKSEKNSYEGSVGFEKIL